MILSLATAFGRVVLLQSIVPIEPYHQKLETVMFVSPNPLNFTFVCRLMLLAYAENVERDGGRKTVNQKCFLRNLCSADLGSKALSVQSSSRTRRRSNRQVQKVVQPVLFREQPDVGIDSRGEATSVRDFKLVGEGEENERIHLLFIFFAKDLRCVRNWLHLF